MTMPPIISYNPGDRIKIHLNGISTLKRRKLNFPSDSNFSIIEDEGNNRFDIRLGNISDKSKLPSTTMFRDQINSMTVPQEWSFADLSSLLPADALHKRVGIDTDARLKIVDSTGDKRIVDSRPVAPDERKTGFLQCIQTTEVGSGFFEGHTTEQVSGTISRQFDTVHGTYIRQTTQAAIDAKARRSIVYGATGFTRPEWNPTCKVKFRIPDSGASADQLFMGFVNKTTLNTTALPFNNSDHGVMAGADNTDPTWDTYVGNGSAVTSANLGSGRDAGWNTIEISAVQGGTKWLVNLNEGATINTITTGIPLATENLWFHCEFQVKSAVAKSLDSAYLIVQSDK